MSEGCSRLLSVVRSEHCVGITWIFRSSGSIKPIVSPPVLHTPPQQDRNRWVYCEPSWFGHHLCVYHDYSTLLMGLEGDHVTSSSTVVYKPQLGGLILYSCCEHFPSCHWCVYHRHDLIQPLRCKSESRGISFRFMSSNVFVSSLSYSITEHFMMAFISGVPSSLMVVGWVSMSLSLISSKHLLFCL